MKELNSDRVERQSGQPTTHYDGKPCTVYPCAECGDTELCECDMLRCESCEKRFCHDHAFIDREQGLHWCHDHGLSGMTYREGEAMRAQNDGLRRVVNRLAYEFLTDTEIAALIENYPHVEPALSGGMLDEDHYD